MEKIKPVTSWTARYVLALSIPVGVGTFISVLVATALLPLPQNVARYSEKLDITDLSLAKIIFDIVLLSIVVAPILETVIFRILGWIALRGFGLFWTVLYASLTGLVAWWLHGADHSALNRALGFVLLAVWYRKIARESGVNFAFIGTAAAHATWNMMSVTAWLIGSALSG